MQFPQHLNYIISIPSRQVIEVKGPLLRIPVSPFKPLEIADGFIEARPRNPHLLRIYYLTTYIHQSSPPQLEVTKQVNDQPHNEGDNDQEGSQGRAPEGTGEGDGPGQVRETVPYHWPDEVAEGKLGENAEEYTEQGQDQHRDFHRETHFLYLPQGLRPLPPEDRIQNLDE